SFRDHRPELLVSVGQARSAQEKQRDALQRGTRAVKENNIHSRFGGSYVVQGLKSFGGKDVIYHRGLQRPPFSCGLRPGLATAATLQTQIKSNFICHML
uniref:Uncharacterized protein n=1 Tax=Oncorhynchus tshawytscha TaxID=74940 RepID=A0A8C8HDI3_ONCTS